MRTFLIGRAHSRIRYKMRAQAIGRANLRIYARYTVRARVTGRENLCIYAHVTQCACAPLIGREIQAFTHVTQCACARVIGRANSRIYAHVTLRVRAQMDERIHAFTHTLDSARVIGRANSRTLHSARASLLVWGWMYICKCANASSEEKIRKLGNS